MNVIFPYTFFLWFFFLVSFFVNPKVGWTFFEYNGLLVMGGNCKKFPINIIFIPPNGNMLDFNFCNFKCIVTSMLQLTIEISSIIIYLIVGQMSIIEFWFTYNDIFINGQAQ